MRTMQSKDVFYGTREEWLDSETYIVEDIYDDKFAINFETITIAEQINNRLQIEEPEFIESPF